MTLGLDYVFYCIIYILKKNKKESYISKASCISKVTIIYKSTKRIIKYVIRHQDKDNRQRIKEKKKLKRGKIKMQSEWERAGKTKWIREELVTVCGHVENGCSLSAVVQCFGANLSGDAHVILRSEWLMKAEQSLGTEEAVCEWSILMSSPADCILTAGDVMYGSQRVAPFLRTIIRRDCITPASQIYLNGRWQNNYLALTPRTSAAVDVHTGRHARIYTCFQKLR